MTDREIEGRREQLERERECRGRSIGREAAFHEGYLCRYESWLDGNNPYPAGTIENDGWTEGYCEAVGFA